MRRALVLAIVVLPIVAILLLPRFRLLRRPAVTVRVTRLAPPGEPVLALGDGSERRDGGTLAGVRFTATSAGLTLHGDDGRHHRTLDRALGLASHDLVAACAWGDRIVGAAASGSLVVTGPQGDQTFQIDAGLTDLLPDGESLLLATTTHGVLRWRGGETAEQLGIPSDAPIVALAAGSRGVAVATGRGEIWLLPGAAEPRRLAPPDEDPPLAITWDGADLLIGHRDRIDRLDAAGRLVRVRSDLGAAALAVDDGRIYAAHPDGGLLVFRPGEGAERGTLTGVLLHRLRATPGGIIAFGRGGAWRIDGEVLAERWVDPVPSRLAASRVGALLVERDALWVGTERGIDILDGETTRHLVVPPVRALVSSPETREVIALTASGQLRIDREGRVERDLGPALTVDATPRVTTPEGLLTGDADGLSLTDPLTWRARRLRAPVPVRGITALARFGDDLWIGSADGLIRLPIAPLLAAPPQS